MKKPKIEITQSPQKKKMYVPESGHAKNLANFEAIIANVQVLGVTYNPTRTAIKLTSIQALATSARAAITAVHTAAPVLSNAIASRELSFELMRKMVSRINSFLRSTDSSDLVDKSARTLIRKIQGVRASRKLSDEEVENLAANGIVIKQVSASQMSFDNRLDNFEKLIKLLTSIPNYLPNEADLKITALNTLYVDLKAKNNAVLNASVALKMARLQRNEVMYKPNVGLVDISVDTKLYIKSIYGVKSPVYKQFSSLQIKLIA